MASSEQDRTNPYRYGVLNGNHVEERHALDLLNKQVWTAANKARGALPPSTMKDHYRWYNSALFEQREQLGERYPELAEQVKASQSLRPFLQRPVHLAQQDQLSGQAALGNKQATDSQQQAKLFVCCPQEDNLVRHGTSYLPLNTNEQAANLHNAPQNGREVVIKKKTTSLSMEAGC